MAESADRGIYAVCVIHGIGVGWRRVGPPGNRRMGCPDRDAIRHVARTGVSAGSKTANPGKAAAEVGPVTFLTTDEAALLPRLRFGVSAMQGRISPPRRMPGRAGGVAVLSVETRIETAHLGYPPPEVAAVTPEAYVAVAHKSRSVIDNPIVGVLS